MQITNNTNGDSFHLKFLVSRNFGAYVLTTFLPVMILGLTGDLSHLFESTNFSDRVMLTLTAFIVAASLFAAVSGTNSGTTEVRALDVFFFYYIFRLFMIVVSHTLQGIMLRKVHQQPTGDEKLLGKHALAEVDPKGYLKSAKFSEELDDAPSTPVYIPLKTAGKEKLLGQAWAIQPTTEKKRVEATPSRFWENTFDKILLTLGIVLDLVFLGLFVAVVIFGMAGVREKFDNM
ncbi:uncharacterized protein LOC135209879 [Macrobrachium nipponense]|uniref:uncharacterized protein LOC135209879 n=1 Tax=Macrobrachium nipponense TaxID=159736 RepID=UPI0030C8B141